MTAPDATLTGRLREALARHTWHHTRTTHCVCGVRTPLAQLAIEGYNAHLADVAAQTVAAWLREQRETVAEEIELYERSVGALEDTSIDQYADAALAALVAAIGGAE